MVVTMTSPSGMQAGRWVWSLTQCCVTASLGSAAACFRTQALRRSSWPWQQGLLGPSVQDMAALSADLDSAAQRMHTRAGLSRIAERHKRQLDCSILQVCFSTLMPQISLQKYPCLLAT